MGEFVLTSVYIVISSCRQKIGKFYVVPNIYHLGPFILFSFAGKDVTKLLFIDANSEVITAVLLKIPFFRAICSVVEQTLPEISNNTFVFVVRDTKSKKAVLLLDPEVEGTQIFRNSGNVYQ